MQVNDEVVKFVHFYRKATLGPMSADERWILWKKDYGLAAVPPTPFGQTLARTQLHAVWDRYAALIPKPMSRPPRNSLMEKEPPA